MPEFNPYLILQRPVITEKSTGSIEHLNAYIFQVTPRANKIEIKKAVEKQFNVKVVKVNTRWKRGKVKRLGRAMGRTSAAKEAVITLRPGDKIEVF